MISDGKSSSSIARSVNIFLMLCANRQFIQDDWQVNTWIYELPKKMLMILYRFFDENNVTHVATARSNLRNNKKMFRLHGKWVPTTLL